MTLRLGLIGCGIARSMMPQLQEYLGRLAGIPISYSLIDSQKLPGFNLLERIASLADDGFHGLNITSPYKQRVLPRVTAALVPGHDRIGSYNSLRFEGKSVFGANTDYSGFQRGYRRCFGQQRPGTVMLCGAGGVGRAVAFGLARIGAKEIQVFDVDKDQANSLCVTLHKQGVCARVIEGDTYTDAVLQAEGLVQCSTLGMYSSPGNAFPDTVINKQCWAFDAICAPVQTEFLGICKRKGIPCMSGFDLWIHQGLDAFELFTGVNIAPSEKIMATALGWLME